MTSHNNNKEEWIDVIVYGGDGKKHFVGLFKTEEEAGSASIKKFKELY